jgi:hypothetical protein
MMQSNQPYQKADDWSYQWDKSLKAIGFGVVQGTVQEVAATALGEGRLANWQFRKGDIQSDNRLVRHFIKDGNVSRAVRDNMLYQNKNWGDNLQEWGMKADSRAVKVAKHLPDIGLKTNLGRVLNYGTAITGGMLAGFMQD